MNFIRTILVLAILLFSISNLANAAQPSRIWLTLTDDTSHEIMVSFTVAGEESGAAVEYGETPAYGMTAAVESKENMGGDVQWVHHIRVKNLSPDTLYHYRITIGSDSTNNYTFLTAPEDFCKPFSFIAMGDNRSQGSGSAFGASYFPQRT